MAAALVIGAVQVTTMGFSVAAMAWLEQMMPGGVEVMVRLPNAMGACRVTLKAKGCPALMRGGVATTELMTGTCTWGTTHSRARV